jgi:hypothetical protein
VILFAERTLLFLMFRRIFYFRLLFGLVDSMRFISKILHSPTGETAFFSARWWSGKRAGGFSEIRGKY